MQPMKCLVIRTVSVAALVALAVVTAGSAAASGARAPVPVSPVGQLADRCPSFSWTEVAEAEGYELVAYRLGEGGEVAAEPVLRQHLPAGAQSWTPAAGDCLVPGERYAWSIRAVGADEGSGAAGWSEAAVIDVQAAPSIDDVEAAIATLRRYLREGGPSSEAAEGIERTPGAGPGPPKRSTSPDRRARSAAESRGLDRPLTSDTSGESAVSTKDAPAASSTPSLTVSDQIHLGAASDFFKDGDLFLWDDTSGNLALGDAALASAAGTARSNTAVGFRALHNTTQGSSVVHGSDNTAVGRAALYRNTTGRTNTAVGEKALFDNTRGYRNTAVGSLALYSNSTGISNTAVGHAALFHNSTGKSNTAVGHYALNYNTEGSRNVAVGRYALRHNTEGIRNVAVGMFAGLRATTGDDNIFISNYGSAGDSGVIRIGRLGTQTEASIAGDRVGLGTESPGNRLHVRDAKDGFANLANHVALIENVSTGTSADVLALRVAGTDPTGAQNFITFFDGEGGVGAIDGDGGGGVTYTSSNADFAEYLPKLYPEEALGPGDVVGLIEGRVTRRIDGVERLLVVSTSPAVLGNASGDDEPDGHVAVAFLGQVPVRVRGAVRAGDYLVASGAGDGTAVAHGAGELDPSTARLLIGRALEGSGGDGGLVRATVGLPDVDPLVTLLEAQQEELRALRGRLEELAAEQRGGPD